MLRIPGVRAISGRLCRRALLSTGAALALGLLPATVAVAAPADSVRGQQQWVFDMMDVQPAWQVTEGAKVTVAVLDSGVDPNVSDLSGAVITGPDYTSLRTLADNHDWGQHGTWMASIIAGRGNGFDGEDGIRGMAPKAKILSVRVIPDMNDPGYHHYDDEPEKQIQDELASGITWAVKHGAQVISMSIGYSAPSSAVRAAIQYAFSRGAVLVASSGNSGDNDTRHAHGMAPVSFPAEYPGVLSVGAVKKGGSPTAFSSANLSVRVAAPGKGVPAQGRSGQYYTVDGTSPACALVAGVAALIKSAYPAISPSQVFDALTSTARQNQPGPYDVRTGFGIVDADAALKAAGTLMHTRLAKSQVPLSAHFGGGPAAQPGPPVAPRGDGRLIVYLVLALVSAAAVGGGVIALARTPRARQ